MTLEFLLHVAAYMTTGAGIAILIDRPGRSRKPPHVDPRRK